MDDPLSSLAFSSLFLMMGQVEENASPHGQRIPVERVQIGTRMEKNLVKVLKALAEYFDVTFQ